MLNNTDTLLIVAHVHYPTKTTLLRNSIILIRESQNDISTSQVDSFYPKRME